MSSSIEASLEREFGTVVVTAGAAYASGEILQLSDGRASVVGGAGSGYASGAKASLYTAGQFNVKKANGVTFLAGEEVFWDYSANTAINAGSAIAEDFSLGRAVVAAASGDTTVLVDFNVNPPAGARRIDFSSIVPGTETNGSLVTTQGLWLSHTAVGACAFKLLCANAAASGDYATMRLRGRSDAAGSTECLNCSASAGINDHGDLYAVRGYAQPNAYTQAGAANIVCGVYSCIDATGTSVGRRWSTWIDDHSTTKASGGHYLCRMSQNGTVAIDGAFTIYTGGRLPVLFNIEDAAGFLTDTSMSLSSQAGALAVKTPAGTRYIPLYSS